ncbi:MAG: hypothetical protein IT383_29180 [Deltaproteobacteria bacterium]|nr:hypothetical protein [Deltaproteobacteria bacterium]
MRSAWATGALALCAAGLLASPAGAERFLCNSINADGSSFNDGCGACSASSAARWAGTSVSFRFDRDQAPAAAGVSAARWSSDVDRLITAWNAVPGSTLSVVDGGDATSRTWDGNEAAHEVFWATSDQDWTEATGTAPNGGVRGATSRAYACDQNADGRREPWRDADVILNGAPSSGLAWNCEGTGCASSLTVAMHEVGHALGLGHPCAECEDAVMGAVGVLNHDRPLPEDILSFLALYGESPQALGGPCAADDDCAAGLSCTELAMPSRTLRFCSRACGAGCPGGFACDDDACVHASWQDAALPGPLEPCDYSCVDDCIHLGGPGQAEPGCSICLAGRDGNNDAQCVPGCSVSSGAGCAADEFCRPLSGDEGACEPKQRAGEFCTALFTCVSPLACVGGVCQSACDAGSCPNADEFCTQVAGADVCTDGGAGQVCDSLSDCDDPAFVCTGFTEHRCWQRCADAACQSGQVCADIEPVGELCIVVADTGESCAPFNTVCGSSGDACVRPQLVCSRACDPADGCDNGDECRLVSGDWLCMPPLPLGEGEGEGEGDPGEGEGDPGEGEGEGDPGEGELPPCGCGAPVDAGWALALALLLRRRRRG